MRWVYRTPPNSYIEKKTDNSWIEVRNMRFSREYTELEQTTENGNPVVLMKNEEGLYVRLLHDKIMYGYSDEVSNFLNGGLGFWVLERISNLIIRLLLQNNI